MNTKQFFLLGICCLMSHFSTLFCHEGEEVMQKHEPSHDQEELDMRRFGGLMPARIPELPGQPVNSVGKQPVEKKIEPQSGYTVRNNVAHEEDEDAFITEDNNNIIGITVLDTNTQEIIKPKQSYIRKLFDRIFKDTQYRLKVLQLYRKSNDVRKLKRKFPQLSDEELIKKPEFEDFFNQINRVPRLRVYKKSVNDVIDLLDKSVTQKNVKKINVTITIQPRNRFSSEEDSYKFKIGNYSITLSRTQLNEMKIDPNENNGMLAQDLIDILQTGKIQEEPQEREKGIVGDLVEGYLNVTQPLQPLSEENSKGGAFDQRM